MKKINLLFPFLLVFQTLFAQLAVKYPRLENLQNPLGIDTPKPRFGWQIAAADGRRNVLQTAYEIRVAANPDDLLSEKNLILNTKKRETEASVWINYDGKPLQSGKKYCWQVRVWDNAGNVSAWCEPNFWQMGLLKPTDWTAKFISPTPEIARDTIERPSPIFRKKIVLDKKVAAATAFITAHGLYEAEINGQRIGQDYLTPGWTSYQKRLQYQVYDVTGLLKNGENVVGATLGSGWWRGYIGFAGQKDFYGKDVALLFQIEIEYADGSRETVNSDGTWKCSTGEIRSSEIYHGETQNARFQQVGWSSPGFDDSKWGNAVPQNFSKEILIGTENEPIRKHETFAPVKIFKTPNGELVADFGQNLVGWVELKAKGKRGKKVVLQFAEVLDKQGNFYTANLRDARCTDVWMLKGGGDVENFEPKFTFHGFRYAKIEGYPGDLKPENIKAVALYSAMRPAGNFTTSDPLVNQLQKNIQWGQRGNFVDVPTDCPQRDERLGWTGDAQAFSRTATFNFDAHNFYAKWLKDVAADQQPNGMVPYVIPNVLGKGAGGSTGWADAATIIPWNMWLAYGDRRILENQYESMKNWVEFMRSKSKNDLWNKGFHFGDWLFYSRADDNDGRSAITDKYLIAQCFYIHSTELLVNTARVLGKKSEADSYSELLKKIKTAFLNEYVTANGRTVSPTQTAYVLALQFDLLPENQREQAAKNLAANIKSYGNHLTTGFLGTPYLCHVLTRFGYNDLAFKLLNQKTYPSWLYPVTMGATTIWERWDGIKPDSTFQAVTMNSFNHYAYGAIGDWMYRKMAGLDTDLPGYKSLKIEPRPGGGFSQAAAELETLFGHAASRWQIGDDKNLVLEIEVPANTTATVFVPTKDVSTISENGKPLAAVKEIHVAGVENEKVKLEIGSGKYRFSVAGWGANLRKINLKDYIGKYKVEGESYTHIQIVEQNGEMALQTLFFTEILEPDAAAADTFKSEESSARFVRNAAGKVVQVFFTNNGAETEGKRE